MANWFKEFRRKHFSAKINLEEYAFDRQGDVRTDIKSKYGYDGPLLDLFVNNKDVLVHKWHHFFPIYELYFSAWRNRPLRFLEIGVSEGGSLQMWRRFFGEEAVIFGIDINPDCAALNGRDGQVRIGSQADSSFLESVLQEMGGVDVVLDDGSHRMDHVLATLQYLMPRLADGGIYMIEDLHTAYWPRFGGGYRSADNFFNVVRRITDDMHHWYHKKPMQYPEISSHCRAIHTYDSIVVLEKGELLKPVHSQIV